MLIVLSHLSSDVIISESLEMLWIFIQQQWKDTEVLTSFDKRDNPMNIWEVIDMFLSIMMVI